MFIQLEMSWINHPFPMSSFRISSPEQIRVLREIGVKSVRYVPAKSTFSPLTLKPSAAQADRRANDAAEHVSDVMDQGGLKEKDLVAAYRSSQQRCQQRFLEATSASIAVFSSVHSVPQQARERADSLIAACVADLLAQGPCAAHLLTGSVGQHSAVHAVNVVVLALLLGQSLGMQAQELRGLGVSALLHDLGKVSLPGHIGEPGSSLGAADMQRYRDHVGLSVELGQRMDLPSDVLIAIAQHHEMADGSGFPLHLMAEDISRWGQILALVNRYDRLCNPLHGELAFTPHEAVARLFALQRECFDEAVLAAFIRMMGVYPPGSLVQLVDGRFAIVVIVDPSRPLRPCVVPYQPDVQRDDAPLLNLARNPEFGILRSLKPVQLPREVLDYLRPQPRICYFFEPAQDVLERENRS
ncbi:HD-GYP domain-containing protein [Alicycliphilus denitrificans]|uniref:HD-GYP domain-containing protein n=1 Tax=Alicycliphilus denitrificans TaxID=179636 RepID=UPI003850EFCF